MAPAETLLTTSVSVSPAEQTIEARRAPEEGVSAEIQQFIVRVIVPLLMARFTSAPLDVTSIEVSSDGRSPLETIQ